MANLTVASCVMSCHLITLLVCVAGCIRLEHRVLLCFACMVGVILA